LLRATQIRPKLDYQFSLARRMELVDAVQEIAMIDNAGGTTANEWLSEEYREILRDQEQIRYFTANIYSTLRCRWGDHPRIYAMCLIVFLVPAGFLWVAFNIME
jgi:hypothetical protein